MLTERLHTSKYSIFDRLLAIDFFLIVIVIAIGAISVFAIHSTESGEFSYYTKNHLIRLISFFVMFLFLSFVKITFWYRNAYIFYIICLFLLIVVLLFGVTASGSKRWVNLYFLNLQPSELMKIAIIVCFARYYHRIQSAELQSYRFLLIPIVLLIIPCYLVVTQPDLGTSILIAGSGIVVIWIAGLNIKYFVYSGLLFLVSFPFIVSILKPYQKSRILTFFNPDRDPLGAGYQIIQSKIAIGSGGFFVRSFFAKLYCFGFASAVFLYVFVNISMVLGLLPIVGAPLPIMSYGGSSMMAIMFGLGVAMSCRIYKDTPVN